LQAGGLAGNFFMANGKSGLVPGFVGRQHVSARQQGRTATSLKHEYSGRDTGRKSFIDLPIEGY
jgi:hypothetical protein